MIGAGFSVMTPRGDGREGLWGPRRLTYSRARNEEVIIPVKDGEVKAKKFSDHLDAVANQVTRWYRKHRRAFYVTIAMLELVYIFGTVPLRVAFFFDPYAAKRGATHWTKSLTIYSTFDVLCEVASVVSLFEMFAAQRRALAAIAADAANGQIRPRMRGRRGQNPNQSGKETKTSLVAWSLNTIVPTVKQKFDIRQPLIYEAIAMIPFEALALGFGVNSLHLFRSHKLFRLHRVADCLMEIKRLHARNSYVQLLDFTGNALLVKRVLIGLLLCHLIACTYMAIAHWQCGLDFQLCQRGLDANYHSPGDPVRYTCWAIEDQLVGATPLRKYARAMYWASRSMITLGYYDVAPITDVETAFAIMVQVVGAIFSTSLIATFLFVFRHLNSRKQDFMTHVDEAKEYMKMSKIPEDIRDAVLTFYRNAWEAHGGLSQSEVSEKLPGHLRVRVTSVLITQRVQQVAFLAKESIEFINTLALKMDTCVYSPKDWIIEKIPDGMFFIIRGNVMIESLSQSQPRYAKAGDYFAEFAILYPGRADDRVRAQTYCELYKLAQRWFHETMELFHRHEAPAQLERMRSMLNRRDQQQQKMKRMLGRSMGELGGDSDRALSLTGQSLGSRYQLSWNMPGSTFRRWWELLRIIFLTFVSYEVPFFIVFDTAVFPFKKTPKYNIQSLTSLAGEIFFTFDFVLRCRFFAFIDPLARIPVNDASYIFEWYKGNGLWWDLFSVIPVSTVLEFTYGPQWMIGPVFRLVRMLRLRHFPAMIQDLAQTRGLSSKVQLAITLFLSVTLSLHIMGCLWFLMARLSMEEDHFDVPTANLTRTGCLRDATRFGNCSWAVFDAYGQIGDGFPIATISTDGSVYTSKLAYLRSIYWAVVALTTVGYGDIVAFSTHESLFAALWAFIGGVINYAVVAAMSNIISNLTATSHHHMEKMNQVNLAMAHYRISEKLRTQIRRFYHQQFYMQKVASEAKLLMRLPQQLRHRISLILHAESVRKVSLFADHGNERLLHDITGQFRRAVFQRGDYISHENTICDEAFVIISGRANMFRKKMMSVPVGALHQGVTYGVAEMLLQVNWPATSIAATVVEVSVITHQAFAMMIERRFPNDTAELKEKAAVDYDAELGLLDAVAGNFRLYDKLHRYSDRCTSMFVSQDNSASQSAKERVRFYWDILVILLMMYNAFVISFRIPFLKHPTEQVRRMLIGLDLWCDALMGADIMLKLYYFECDAGLWNLVARQEKNANYAQHYLKQDLWSLLPLYYIGDNFFVMSLCRLPRLVRLRQLSSSIDSLIVRIQERFASVGNISAYLGPVKLMMVLIFAAHFADCIFYWISTMDHNPNSWIHHDHVVHQEHGSVSVLYLRSFYWSLTTLTLVGSRELVPLDTPSTLFAGLTCLCCTFVVGHIIGELSDLTLELDKAKKELQERESSFEEFAKDHDLPTSIRNRVAEYLSFQHMYSKGIDLGVIFDDLSPNLRVQLMMDLHGDVLRNLPITQYLSDSQLRALALHLKSELYIPGDNVIVEGDPGHKLYVLKRGSATVLWKSTGTAVATLAVGSLFGEVAFFLKGTKRIASVQMAVASEVLVIDRRSWDRLMLSSGVAERNKTETSMVQWVRDCLKGYNVMTVEVVNDLKCVVSQVEANSMNSMGIDVKQNRRFIRQLSRKKVQGGISRQPSQRVLKFSLGGLFRHRMSPKIYAATSEINQTTHSNYASQRSTKHTEAGGIRRRYRSPSVQRVVHSVTSTGSLKHFSMTKSSKFLHDMRHLRQMEDECWRRYKISIFMAGTFSKEVDGVVPHREGMDFLNTETSQAHETHIIDRLLHRNSANIERSFATSAGLITLVKAKDRRDHRRNLDNRYEQSNPHSYRCPETSSTVEHSRVLNRSQSLPLFDRHFESRIVAELNASNIKRVEDMSTTPASGLQRKIHNLQQSRLFKLYRWWVLKHRSNEHPAKQSFSRRTKRWSLLHFPSLQRDMKPTAAKKDTIESQAEDFFELLSRCHRLWECIVVFIALFYAVSLPLLICFASRIHTSSSNAALDRWVAFVVTVDVVCIADFLLKYSAFRRIRREHSDETEEVPLGLLPKLDGHFLFEVFVTFPLDFLLFFPHFESYTHAKWYYLSLFQLNKIFRIYEAKEASERLAQFLAYDLNLPIRDSTLRFLRSTTTYLLAGHWIACIWYRTSLLAFETYDVSWFVMPKMLAVDQFTSLPDISLMRAYLRSAHFAAGSITTVFYGDIASCNVLETVVEIGVIICSIFVFGMLAGAHTEHLVAKYKHRMKFEQDLVELYYYLKSNEVPREIRKRLKLYYLNTWLRYHGHDDFEGVHGLSTLLVEDIAQYTLRGFSASVSIFKSCDECFLRALLTCLKHIICSPSEQIVRKGDVDRSMYFISHGKVLVEGTGFQLVKEEGDFFGELSLLYGIPRSATCSSLGTSLLYVLEWEAYERILLDYPEYRRVNRREWVIVSTKLRAGDSRFRSIVDIVSRMENASWVQVDEIIRKAKNLK